MGDLELLTDDHEQEDDGHQRYDCFHLQEEHRHVLHVAPCVAPASFQLEKCLNSFFHQYLLSSSQKLPMTNFC